MSKNGITVAGTLLADVFHSIDTYPGEGLLVRAEATGVSIGGIGNIILDLARLDKDLEVNVSALLGEDEVAKSILDTLKKHKNIRTDCIVCRGESSRTFGFVYDQ